MEGRGDIRAEEGELVEFKAECKVEEKEEGEAGGQI